MNEVAQYNPKDFDIETIQRTAKLLAASGYFVTANDMTQAIAQLGTQIMAGAEMGMGPFTAVQSIHIIKGKPTMSANGMAAAVKAHPKYDYKVMKINESGCAIEFFEGSKSLGTSIFSAEDAKKAGTQNMDKYGRNMLFARAMSNGVRWFCPDVFRGSAVYTADELGEEPRGVNGGTDADLDFTMDDVDEIPFEDNGDAPMMTDDQHTMMDEDDSLDAKAAIIAGWGDPNDAMAWAQNAYGTPSDAKAAFGEIVSEKFGGKLTNGNVNDVYAAWYDAVMAANA